MSTISTTLELLNQEIDDDEALYRIRAGRRVHYLTITLPLTSDFDIDTLCQPRLLIPKLPPFPDADWTTMAIFKGADGTIDHETSSDPLRGVETLWHPRRIDVLSLKRVASHAPRVDEVQFEGKQALYKIATFDWWIPKLQHETEVYKDISHRLTLDEPHFAPEILGHVMEQDRCIGFLMEKIRGSYASLKDAKACKAALSKLHQAGWVHGDANRHNFIVDQSTGQVKMIDFEHALPFDEAMAEQEIADLEAELEDTSGRGGTVVVQDGVECSAGPIPYPKNSR